MIDVHSHILPHIDDGAKDVNMSLDMLAKSYEQGVTTVIATPHCYLKTVEQVDAFVAKRQESYDELIEAIKNDKRTFPKIKLGAELQFLCEITDYDKLRPLCIEGTDYILVEMPPEKWTIDRYDQIYCLMIHGMKPVMAHIERFWVYKKEFYNLYSLDVGFQVNAESFLHRSVQKPIRTLFENGKIQIIGSDMHNTASRSTKMKEAQEEIIKKYGEACYDYLTDNAERLIQNKPIKFQSFEKISRFKKKHK